MKVIIVLLCMQASLHAMEQKINHLESLPLDVQNDLAQFLDYPAHETDDRFKDRLEKQLPKQLEVEHIMGTFFNKKANSLYRKLNNTETLIMQAADNERISSFGISPNGRYMAIIKNNCIDILREEQKGFFVIQLDTKEQCYYPFPEQLEKVTHFTSSKDEWREYINNGYSFFLQGSGTKLFGLQKPYNAIAISCNGDQVAIANTDSVYLIDLKQKKAEKIKGYPITIQFISLDWVHKFKHLIEVIEFNYQSTKIGIVQVSDEKENNVELLSFKEEPKRTLREYLHKRGVTKNINYFTY